MILRDGLTRSIFHTNTICLCMHSILSKICRKKAIVVKVKIILGKLVNSKYGPYRS